MKLFSEGDLLSIQSVYWGVSEHFIVLIQVCYIVRDREGERGREEGKGQICQRFVKFSLNGNDVNE